MTTAVLKPKRCARCDRVRSGRQRELMVRSAFTGSYYCGPTDGRACDRISRRARALDVQSIAEAAGASPEGA